MDAIESIIARAEVLLEVSQLHMCSLALDEIAERLKTAAISNALMERYQHLCRRIPSAERIVGLEPDNTCPECHGSGKYRQTNNRCYACRGKGVQTPADKVLQKNYLARKQRIISRHADFDHWLE